MKGKRYIKNTNKLEFIISDFDGQTVSFHENHYPNLRQMLLADWDKIFTPKEDTMTVELASVGNPDFRQDPDQPMYGCEPNKIVRVVSFKEASEVCQKFIGDNDLGSGNWAGGDIKDDKGVVIAMVSYNGRVWKGGSLTGKNEEIKF